MTSVYIAYGICSGPKRATRLLKALRMAGYRTTKDKDRADIFIGHSAGCFWLPKVLESQRVILIDPPYWPGKTIRKRSAARARSNLHFKRYGYPFGYWLVRNLWGGYYLTRDLNRHLRIVRFAPDYDLATSIAGRNVLLVRNEHDDWLTPDFAELQRISPQLQTVTVPGDHDDFLYNPESYIRILEAMK